MAVLLRGNFLISTLLHRSCLQYALNRTKYLMYVRNIASATNLQKGFSKYFKSISPLHRTEHLYSCNIKFYYSSKSNAEKPLNLDSSVQYENVSEDTMQSLYDRFEELLQDSKFEDWDVNYSNGVLTVMLEKSYTYVINKQTPNRQIWLSSPVSGPKRYDYINGTWIYKHDGKSLHQLLSDELTELLEVDANFMICTFSK